jgi:sugar/nucleoside kinase (ribokinase family)
MCTFLGIAGKINKNDINISSIKNSEITFLEGYLWDEGEPKNAFNEAIQHSNTTAMSLSDKFCVDRHKKNFLELVQKKLDIIFANEQEALELIDAKSFDEVISFGKELNKILVITRSSKGSIVVNQNEVVVCESKKNLKIVDLTGAGDLFAAGFLDGYIKKKSIKESLEKGTEMASKVIQKIGARLN